MFNSTDPYTFTQYQTLYANFAGTQTPIGQLYLEYQVAIYNDVQVSSARSVSQPQNQQFILNCTQRIILQNDFFTSLTPSKPAVQSYLSYPAIFKLSFAIAAGPDTGLNLNLLDYSPQTVNTSVQTSGSNTDTDSAGISTSTSATSGTQNWTSSSYSASVQTTALNTTLGSVAIPVSSAANTSTSSSGTNTSNSNSTGTGLNTSTGEATSSSSSMSIKNWGAYSSVDPSARCPSWVFGQEFPWNAIQCRYISGDNVLGTTPTGKKLELATNDPAYGQLPIYVSQAMVSNLWDGVFLYPPSELSLFGLNFVVKATWRVYVDFTKSTEVTISNPISYFAASHVTPTTGAETTTTVYIEPAAAPLYVYDAGTQAYMAPSIVIDLNFMALSPIGQNAGAAVIGFIPNKFIPPIAIASASATAPVPPHFKTIASTNDLLVQDTTTYPAGSMSGFTVSENCLTATWSDSQQMAYQITLYFKIIDSMNNYALHIKHWITRATDVILTIVTNGDAATKIVKYVTTLEAQGGEDNILSISLRDLNFTSLSYHDFLQLGLNSIQITIEPIDQDWSDCAYQIRAIAIR